MVVWALQGAILLLWELVIDDEVVREIWFDRCETTFLVFEGFIDVHKKITFRLIL